jgi:hypothetical protein
MPQAASINSLSVAFEVMKAVRADGLERDQEYRPFVQRPQAHRAGGGPGAWVATSTHSIAEDEPNRRNGQFLGNIEVNVPRTRGFTPRGQPTMVFLCSRTIPQG